MLEPPTDLHRLEETLKAEIAAAGSISFERFMEVALYHPQCGYYCRGPKPIGVSGDFFTASQLQPVYGALIRQYAERLAAENGLRLPHSLLECGAGRGEMAEAFQDWQYRALEVHSSLPESSFSGVIFGNELFDAMPVRSAMRQGSDFVEQRVGWNGERFVWVQHHPSNDEIARYAFRAGVPAEEGFVFEVHQRSIQFLEDLLDRARNALLLFVDYGYTQRDWKRFPHGTLMAYRKHRADTDVLSTPGERDITSHVPFHLLASVAEACGARVLRRERLASALLFAGERDSFASVLEGLGERSAFERRQQLKTLLYGLGESFSVIAIAKEEGSLLPSDSRT
jgi:SAM-dependent MidA family methyltransferase